MSPIPPEMYERVRDLTLSITNATLADDAALADSHYQQLLAYYEETEKAGTSHPFLVETLADYTDDDREAIGFYLQALAISRESGRKEPTQTILVGMANRWIELGNEEQAAACLRDAYAEALSRGDSDTLKEIEELRKRGE